MTEYSCCWSSPDREEFNQIQMWQHSCLCSNPAFYSFKSWKHLLPVAKLISLEICINNHSKQVLRILWAEKAWTAQEQACSLLRRTMPKKESVIWNPVATSAWDSETTVKTLIVQGKGEIIGTVREEGKDVGVDPLSNCSENYFTKN